MAVPGLRAPERDEPRPRAGGRASLTAFVPPLKVHLCWFDGPSADPRCPEIAREIYELLHRPLEDDVVQRPGTEIPVEYGRDLTRLLDALDRGDEPPAALRLVIVLLDGASYLNPASRALLQRRPVRHERTLRGDEVVLPIVVSGSWGPELRVSERVMLDAIVLQQTLRDGRPRRWALGVEVGAIVGRVLLRELRGAPPPGPRVLVSYSRDDGERLARDLAAHLRNDAGVDAWLDVGERESGEELSRQLEAAGGHGVVLLVRTDRYSECPWRARELLAAKQARAPIVTLVATADGELVASAYGGNHRTMSWRPGRQWELAARCVQAWLHGHHFRAYAAAALARAGLPADADIVPRRPELIDLMGRRGAGPHLLVHPDPPLTDSEAALMRAACPPLRIATPTTLLGRVLLAQDPEPPLTGISIAFSLSVAEDLPRLSDGRVGAGVTQDHVDDVVSSIVLATLSSGAQIMHGGDLRRCDGYTRKLAELHRSRRRLGARGCPQLAGYVDGLSRDGGDDEDSIELHPIFAQTPDGADAFPELRSILWHLAMRDDMAERCHAQVVLGGKLRPSVAPGDAGYTGAWPGVLEEAWRALHKGKALYVLGGFGGAAGAIASMLASGAIPPALARTHHAGGAVRALGRALDEARARLVDANASVKLELEPGRFADIEDLARGLLERWQRFRHGDEAAWNNGLTVAENEQLFRSTNHTEITHLVFEGLRRCARPAGGALKVMLYHGDITSAPGVDGYAVTVTPGVPRAGAAAAIERRLDRPLAGPPGRGGISLESLATDDLPGAQVLVARLELPPAGQQLGVDAVVPLTRELRRRCDELGIEAIACTAFGVSLGLEIDQSAPAMVTAMRNTPGRLPTRLVLCEIDRARYERLRAALGSDAIELQAGPAAPRVADGAVLSVDADEPAPDRPGRVRGTLFLPSGGQSVAPRHEVALTWETWESLRSPAHRFEDTVRLGAELWDRLLSDEIRAHLTRHPEQRLVVLGNDTANGLPWELLSEAREAQAAAPLLARSIVRCVALPGAARAPAGRAARARLRVLLVANPTGDLPHAALEADEVEHLLTSRPDVIVERLDGAAATVGAVTAQLHQGHHDVLHYAGHASFDAADPGGGGLQLADGLLTAAGIHERPPRLVYLSACRSGRLRDADSGPALAPRPPRGNGRSLAEAFLRIGAGALIGTFFMVDDGDARCFASIVHAELAAGRTLGTAVSEARRQLHREHRADWGNFLLYGDDGMIL